MSPSYFVGLDLGQARDYSAWCVEELKVVDGKPYSLLLQDLYRWRTNTGYPTIVDDVDRWLGKGLLKGHSTLMVDQTGVGRPVLDMLRAKTLGGAAAYGVSITGGQDVVEDTEHREFRVPKRDLVSTIAMLLSGKRLLMVPPGQLALISTLVKELESFQVRVTKALNDQYGVWREGQHDDLVLAVALAAWGAERCRPVVNRGRLPLRPEGGVVSLAEERKKALRERLDRERTKCRQAAWANVR